MLDKLICVGAIGGGFGVQGDVRLRSFCANPHDIAKYSPLLDENGKTYTLGKLRAMKDGFTTRINEIPTKEDADALKGTRLFVLRKNFPELENDEYYQSDLIGLMVVDGHGENIGKVKSLQNYGAGDILEIFYKGSTALIPFTRAIVPTVDISAGKLIIDPPEGLLD